MDQMIQQAIDYEPTVRFYKVGFPVMFVAIHPFVGVDHISPYPLVNIQKTMEHHHAING